MIAAPPGGSRDGLAHRAVLTFSLVTAFALGVLVGRQFLATGSAGTRPPKARPENPDVQGRPGSPGQEFVSRVLLEDANAKIRTLEDESVEMAVALAQAERAGRSSPRALLESLLIEPGEVVYAIDLFNRAQQSGSECIKALAMEMKLYDHYSPDDAKKVAFVSVNAWQLSQAGLVAARFLGQNMSPEVAADLNGSFEQPGVLRAGNWLAAVAFHEAGDATYMTRWSNRANDAIAEAREADLESRLYLRVCSLATTLESDEVLLAASESGVPELRRLAIPGLQRSATVNYRARHALERLVEDGDPKVGEAALVALRVLEAR
jgi:hypothetical protein